jgi:hypothetical protein
VVEKGQKKENESSEERETVVRESLMLKDTVGKGGCGGRRPGSKKSEKLKLQAGKQAN